MYIINYITHQLSFKIAYLQSKLFAEKKRFHFTEKFHMNLYKMKADYDFCFENKLTNFQKSF